MYQKYTVIYFFNFYFIFLSCSFKLFPFVKLLALLLKMEFIYLFLKVFICIISLLEMFNKPAGKKTSVIRSHV